MTLSLAQFTSYAGYLSASVIQGTPPDAAFYRQFYQLLKAYQTNNGLYDFINDALQATRISNKNVKPLRNPANRVVEFYAAKLWPGHDLRTALPVVARNENIVDPIYQVWQWSNFASKKQMGARTFANLGDMFIKINTKKTGDEITAVYQQFIDPEYVSEFKIDERGFLTFIRLDIPQTEQRGLDVRDVTYTEVWSKSSQQFTIWVHDQGLDIELEKISSEPVNAGSIEDATGGDFIPFVYQPFRDDGQGRASGAYVATIDKIDEVNIKATRLAQLLFRYGRADKTLSSDIVDSTGRPLPAPSIDAILDSGDGGVVTIDGEKFWKLPSGWKVDNLIANIDFDSHITAINDDIVELQQDLPELLYSKIGETSDLSGKAIRYILEPAIARLLEARGNGESAFVRANQMSLTVAQHFGLFGDLGTFESGALDHTFAPRPVLAIDPSEIADTAVSWVGAGAGLEAAAIEAGLSETRARALAQVQAFGTEENPR